MGCWNETCFITNLPIMGDGEIVCLEAKNEDAFLDAMENSLFSLVNVAVGKLDDYARLHDITDRYITDDKRKPKFGFSDDNRLVLFCYKSAWDEIFNEALKDKGITQTWEFVNKRDDTMRRLEKLQLSLHAKLVEMGENPEPLKKSKTENKLYKEYMFVIGFLRRARIGFAECLHRGSQNIALQYRKFVAELTLRKIAELETLHKEYYE